MANGRIVEEGTHDELMVKQSYYAELVSKQQMAQEPSEKNGTVDTAERNSSADIFSEKNKVVDSSRSSSNVHDSRGAPVTAPSKPSDQKKKSGFSWKTLFTALRFILSMNKPEMLVVVLATFLAVIAGLAVPAYVLVPSSR